MTPNFFRTSLNKIISNQIIVFVLFFTVNPSLKATALKTISQESGNASFDHQTNKLPDIPNFLEVKQDITARSALETVEWIKNQQIDPKDLSDEMLLKNSTLVLKLLKDRKEALWNYVVSNILQFIDVNDWVNYLRNRLKKGANAAQIDINKVYLPNDTLFSWEKGNVLLHLLSLENLENSDSLISTKDAWYRRIDFKAIVLLHQSTFPITHPHFKGGQSPETLDSREQTMSQRAPRYWDQSISLLWKYLAKNEEPANFEKEYAGYFPGHNSHASLYRAPGYLFRSITTQQIEGILANEKAVLKTFSIPQEHLFEIENNCSGNQWTDFFSDLKNGATRILGNMLRPTEEQKKCVLMKYSSQDLLKETLPQYFTKFQELIQEPSDKISIEKITLMQKWFVMMHPFWDGNGRTSRFLQTILFLKKGLLPPIYTNLSMNEDFLIDTDHWVQKIREGIRRNQLYLLECLRLDSESLNFRSKYCPVFNYNL